MNQVSPFGIAKVIAIDLSIVLISALIGVSLNQAFVSGPQETTYEYVGASGGSDFRPVAESHPITHPGFQGISSEQLKELSREGEVILLDGRSRPDYENGHIPGAYHLAVADFDRAFAGLASSFSKDTRFVIYCRGGDCSLSRRLAEMLYEKGYTQCRSTVPDITIGFLIQTRSSRARAETF